MRTGNLRRSVLWPPGGLALLLCVLVAAAQQNLPADLAIPDAEVLTRIHRTNQLEIQAGDLAREKGATAEVQRYGDRLLRDHRFVDDLVMSFADERNIAVGSVGSPTLGPDGAQMMQNGLAQLQKLSGLHGAEFDREFLAFMDGRHDATIHGLNAGKNVIAHDELRVLVSKVLPILAQHREIANRLKTEQQEGSGGHGDQPGD